MNQVYFIFSELFSWRALLDIAIIGGGFFILYRTLVRLGTWKIVVGIGAAFLVYVFARLLGLEGLEWIFQTLSQVAVLALIVIFQPELRKILEKLVSLYTRKSKISNQDFDAVIAQSIWQLAQKKEGAIIVYPGKEPITEKLAGGQSLNADVSQPLILSIFDHSSPGHDGAMIVEANKLVSFGVRLPISQSSRLEEQYGTRHHAAMGLAEVTDALVLVVSEERGQISAFRNGSMQVVKDEQETCDLIVQHQIRNSPINIESLGSIDKRTSLQVGGSILLATVFWLVLASANKQVVERALTLPIEYTSPAEGLMLVGDRIEEARVRIGGAKAAVEEFILDPKPLQVDVTPMVEGKQTVLISDQFLKGTNITFLSSTPSQLVIQLEKRTRKVVTIVPQLVGNLPEGVILKSVTVHPPELEVFFAQVPEADKKSILSTTPVYLNSIQTSSRIFCKIIAPASLQPVVRPWQDVEVSLEVVSEVKTKEK